MQISVKYFSSILWKVFMICTLFLGFSAIVQQPIVHAAQISNDSHVLIAADTSNSGCTEATQVYSTPSTSVTKQVPCPAGTTWSLQIVSRSYAFSRKLPFVALPSKTLSAAVYQQLQPQIAKLHQWSHQVSLMSAARANNPLAFTPCGNTNTRGVSWTPTDFNGNAAGNLYSSIYYRVPASCTYVFLDTSQVQVNSNSLGMVWTHDQYANWKSVNYTCNGGWEACVLNAGYTYTSHPDDGSQQRGYTYETWIDSGGTSWCDILVD